MTEGTNPHNGTIQRADFRLIHPALWWSYQITVKKQPVNHEEKKGYLTRNIRTQFLQKELENLMNNQDYSRKMNDNSEDKILSITSGFKKYKITHLTRPNELGTTTSKVAKGTRTQLGSGTTMCSKLLLGRTNCTRLHCFLQRTDAVHL